MTGIPVLTLADLVRRPRPLAFPVSPERVSLWYSGRAAIWQGLACLGLRVGDRVLAPAYACGAEIEALLGGGVTVDYYRIGPDLVPDLDDIDRLCAQPAQAVLVTHYFGRPQPLDDLLALAAARDLRVIEDAAHGPYSRDAAGRPLGSRGDVGVWSFNKTFAVPDGGALILKEGRRPPAPGVPPPGRRVVGRMKGLFEAAIARRFPAVTNATKLWVLDPLIGWAKGFESHPPATPGAEAFDSDRSRATFRREQATWGMSETARRLLRRTPSPEIVVERRRRNFLALVAGLDGLKRAAPLFRSLPQGCCPLLLPLLAEDGPALRERLLAHGVLVERFGFPHEAVPWERFPLEARLKRDVLLLPVHQGLADEDMADLAALVRHCERDAA